MRVIGLIGPKGSGKDASYEILREQKRVDGKISFAGPLKQVCSEVFNLHINLMNDPDLKEKEMKEPITLTGKHVRKIISQCEDYVPSVTPDGIILYRSNAVSLVGLEGRTFKTPRELLQIIGTDLIRDRIFKGWHRAAAFSDKALSKLKKSGTYVVTDVRFVDEHQFLAEKYGEAYRAYYVDRPEASAKLATATHPSELETQKIRVMLQDSTIKNDGTLEDLGTLLAKLDLGSVGTEKEKKSRFRFGPKES